MAALQQLVKVMMVVIQQQALTHFLVEGAAAVLVQLAVLIDKMAEVAITMPEDTVVMVQLLQSQVHL
jgi:hypothetical protein